AEPASAFDEILRSLPERYPSRDAVQENAEAIVGELRELIDAHPEDPRSGEARRLAAEILLLSGSVTDQNEARRLWADTVTKGPTDEDRAHGLYLLADHYFLRAATEPRRAASFRQSAQGYAERLVLRHPESRWAPRALRLLDALKFRRGTPAPVFEDVRFESSFDSVIHGRESLEGKVVFLLFWRVTSPGHREFERQLLEGLGVVSLQYPILEERFEVLSINLDSDRELFKAAVDRWKLQSPQRHDGRGFETPLARAFAIPRAPHYVVIDAKWRVQYYGDIPEHVLQAGSTALRELRIELEEGAGNSAGEGGESEAEAEAEAEAESAGDGESPPAEDADDARDGE